MSVSALTIKSNVGLLKQLTSIVDITVPNTNTKNQYKAIWDTGASGTVITQVIVDNLGLIPTGMSIVHTANGTARQNTYIIDISLNKEDFALFLSKKITKIRVSFDRPKDYEVSEKANFKFVENIKCLLSAF